MTTFPQLLSVSAEFSALCQQQLQLLAQGIGADWSILYLAQPDRHGQEMDLTAVVAYPPKFLRESAVGVGSMDEEEIVAELEDLSVLGEAIADESGTGDAGKVEQEASTAFPLLHEDLIVGVLTTGRRDRAWRSPEINQIELVTQSLALACVLDQQKSWATQRLSQQRHLQELEQEHFHDLLHQLRNPTMAIGTFGKLLLKRLEETDRNHSAAQGVVRESDRLKSMLSEFSEEVHYLDGQIQTITAGSTLALPPQNVASAPELMTEKSGTKSASSVVEQMDLGEVLVPIVASMAAIATEKRLLLNAEIPPNPMLVLGNSHAITEVVTNLLENAIKYTPASGQILLEVQSNELGVSVAVHDTGYGIPAADLHHVFERHYRGVQAQGEIHGTGLGLAIAHDLVEKMGGDLEVDSPTLGFPQTAQFPGSTFTLWLKAAETSEP
ncbi:MAG: HAMP domain-containing sensor histidine kinase [Limnothrix sp.]